MLELYLIDKTIKREQYNISKQNILIIIVKQFME